VPSAGQSVEQSLPSSTNTIDLDGPLTGWLQEAYNLCRQKHREEVEE
jgi:hypothetical protein